MRKLLILVALTVSGCTTAGEHLGDGKDVWVSLNQPGGKGVFFCSANGPKPTCVEASISGSKAEAVSDKILGR